MSPATSQPSDEPRIDRAGGERTLLGPPAELRISKQPFELGRGEVGIEQQTGSRPNVGFDSGGAERTTSLGGAPVLPDDGGGDGAKGFSVPEHQRLPLVGDPDPGGPFPRSGDCLARRRQGGFDQILGIVLDPARLGIMLRELPPPLPQDAAVLVNDEGAGGGGALV